jgi:hypothetical protein
LLNILTSNNKKEEEMKKRVFWTLAGISLFFIVFAFSTPALADKPIKLRMSSFVPPMHFMNTRILQPWIDMIEKRTDGKIKIGFMRAAPWVNRKISMTWPFVGLLTSPGESWPIRRVAFRW